MKTGWRSLLFSAGLLRAVGEMVVIQTVLTLSAITLMLAGASWAEEINSSFFILAGPCCLCWGAARLQRSTGRWWRQAFSEVVVAGGLGLLYGAIILVLALLVTTLAPLVVGSAITPALISGVKTGFTTSEWFRLLRTGLAGIGGGIFVMFLCLRIGFRLLVFWNRLRRTRMRWALTHAHLLVALMGAGLISALVISVFFVTSRSVLNILPILFLLLILTCIGLGIVLPPSAIFSYFFARRMTRRIESLARAVSALRAGNYGIRISVQGEDEIARLQADFNVMADALERARRDLQAERDNVATLLRARRELIASVSHELRTPVATLRGYLESTRVHWDEAPPLTLHHDLLVMEQETIRLQALINDLFTLARAEVGRLEMRCEPTDVGMVARRVVETMASLAWQSGRVEVVADVAGETPPAQADAIRLEQVLHNLLHNAVRHTPPGGIVAIMAQADLDAVVLHVRDTGEGIDPADLPRIWERFYRTERAREQPTSGTGLGLALVKELVEAMGGAVAVESVPGEGSCFSIRLPCAPGTTNLVADASDARATKAGAAVA